MNDLESAKEIVQDLFVCLFEFMVSLVITASLKSCLYHAVWNRCLNHLNHLKILENHVGQLESDGAERNDPEAMYREAELEESVISLSEVNITLLSNKSKPVNYLIVISGRNFSAYQVKNYPDPSHIARKIQAPVLI